MSCDLFYQNSIELGEFKDSSIIKCYSGNPIPRTCYCDTIPTILQQLLLTIMSLLWVTRQARPAYTIHSYTTCYTRQTMMKLFTKTCTRESLTVQQFMNLCKTFFPHKNSDQYSRDCGWPRRP